MNETRETIFKELLNKWLSDEMDLAWEMSCNIGEDIKKAQEVYKEYKLRWEEANDE